MTASIKQKCTFHEWLPVVVFSIYDNTHSQCLSTDVCYRRGGGCSFLKSNNHKNVSVKLSSHASALLRALEVTQRASSEIYNKHQFGQENDDTSFIIHSRGTKTSQLIMTKLPVLWEAESQELLSSFSASHPWATESVQRNGNKLVWKVPNYRNNSKIMK